MYQMCDVRVQNTLEGESLILIQRLHILGVVYHINMSFTIDYINNGTCMMRIYFMQDAKIKAKLGLRKARPRAF